MRLYISPLPKDITEDELKGLIRPYGEIDNVSIHTKPTFNHSFAFFNISEEWSINLRSKLNKSTWKGNKLSIEVASESFTEKEANETPKKRVPIVGKPLRICLNGKRVHMSPVVKIKSEDTSYSMSFEFRDGKWIDTDGIVMSESNQTKSNLKEALLAPETFTLFGEADSLEEENLPTVVSEVNLKPLFFLHTDSPTLSLLSQFSKPFNSTGLKLDKGEWKTKFQENITDWKRKMKNRRRDVIRQFKR